MIDACKHTHDSFRRVRISLTTTAGIAILLALAGIGLTIPAEAQTGNPVLAAAHMVGDTPASSVRTLSLTLPLRNQDELATLLRHLYTPGDPLYGKYLTPQQFTQEFGPTQQQVDDVEQAALGHGLSTVEVSPNHLIVKVSGRVDAINAAFGVTLHDYVAADGRAFVSGGPEWRIPSDLSDKVHGVVGLDGSHFGHPATNHIPRKATALDYLMPMGMGAAEYRSRHVRASTAMTYSSGPGGLIPTDIWSVYDWGVPTEGVGQSIAFFEMSGWTSSDISTYQTKYLFGNNITPQLVSVDGGTQAEQGLALECTLDIEFALAMAPGISHMYVYVAPNADGESPGPTFEQGSLDIYNKMASDDLATVISSSWGEPEVGASPGYATALENIMTQFEAEGITVCVASQDSGAFADGDTSTPNAGLEPSLPGVLSVGGTNLTDTQDLAYASESSWWQLACSAGGCSPEGGGGGISSIWPIPAYQVGAFSSTSNPQGSQTMRNMPDVALFAEGDAYDVFFDGGDSGIGGTSSSTPLWAGFLAAVNEERGYNGLPNLGFANPAIYAVAESPDYISTFHDINDGSNNGFYNAVTGYDNSTGWGSFQAEPLWEDLSTYAGPTITSISATPSTVTGKTTTIAVTASDAYTSSFTYAWTNTVRPSYVPTIANPNAASTLVTFTGAGVYYFLATVTNRFGLSTALTTAATVNQTPTTLTISPASATVATGSTQQFTDAIADQFGNAYSATTTWSVTGVGSISASGLYTAGATTGTATIKATAAGLTKTATVTVTNSVPPTPTGLAATAGNALVTLTWSPSTGATSYTLYRSTATGTEASYKTAITTTSYTDSGLTNGTTYYYKLAAVNSAGTSAQSGEVHAKPTLPIPPAPTGLTATGGNAQVTLSWTASTGATSYNVYRGTASNGESATAIATGITATVYTNTGLTNGVKYYYKAAAVNTSGTSPQSGEANATPQATSFSGTWQLTPQSATALRLNVSGNGTANETLLTVSTSNGTTAQSFVFNNAGVVPAGDYNFTKQGGSYCVQDAGTTSGSKVDIWACAGTAAQSWAISNASTSGYYLLKPSNASTMCLNAMGTASGSSVTIATCSGATSQSWSGL